MLYGSNLKKIRKSKKITQAKLAKALGKSLDIVNKWENGKRNPCSSDIRIIADILGVGVEQISDIKPNYDSIFVDSHIMRLDKITQEYGKGLSDIDIIAIKDLKETVEGLRKENGRLKKKVRYKDSFLDSIDSYTYVIDKDFNFIDVNTTFLNYLDRPEREVLNSSWSAFFEPNVLTDILRIQQDVFITEKTIKNQKVRLPKNKLGLLSIIPDEYDSYQNLVTAICIIKDITLEEELHIKNQQQEEKRKEVKNLLEKLIDNSPFPISIVRADGRTKSYDYVSPSVTDIIGYSNEDLINGRIRYIDLVHPSDKKKIKEWDKHPSAQVLRYRIKPKNSSCYKTIEEHIFVDSDYHKKIIYFTFVRDISSLSK